MIVFESRFFVVTSELTAAGSEYLTVVRKPNRTGRDVNLAELNVEEAVSLIVVLSRWV